MNKEIIRILTKASTDLQIYVITPNRLWIQSTNSHNHLYSLTNIRIPMSKIKSNNVDVPTDYQLSDTLLGQYKHMVNNQALIVKEECILKRDEIYYHLYIL
ncbi:hypothetical protein ACTFIW_000470 [Dictyostelium discoideum]